MSDNSSARPGFLRRIPRWGWITICVVALIGVSGIARAVGVTSDEPTTTAITPEPSAPSVSSEPSTSTPPSAPPAPAPPAAQPLAPRVEAYLKDQWGVTSFSDGLSGPDPRLLNWYIASIKDVSPGVIEAVVQVTAADTTDAEVELLAKRIGMLSKPAFAELDWVMVQSADGMITKQVRAQ